MNKKFIISIVMGSITTFTMAQQEQDSVKIQQLSEIVITDSRFAIKKENSGKTVIKITSLELERNKGKTISELINTKSGITINGNQSVAGQNLNTYIRGGQNRQVLVLIDGVAMSDPSQIENNFDLQLVAPDQIESIEILKGASSALYGNRASTAVINITLKKPSKNKSQLTMSSFLATNNSQNDNNLNLTDFTNSVGISGTLSKFNYMLNFSNKFTDGLSAIKALEDSPKNSSDQYSKINGIFKLGYEVLDYLDISVFGNFDKYKTDYDDSFSFSDANYTFHSEQNRLGIAPKLQYEKGSINVNAAIGSIKRDFESSYPTRFEARSVIIDAFNKYKFNNNLYSIIGLNYVKTNMDNYTIPFGATNFIKNFDSDLAKDTSLDPYANLTYLSNFGLNLNLGARLNNHSEYGNHFVYNINPSYAIKFNEKELKILSSYSTAFIAPSLYQLFVPQFGNIDLKPQEDSAFEFGLDFSLDGSMDVSVVYFNRKQKNFIDYVVTNFDTFEGEYQNLIDIVKIDGLEVELLYKPFNHLNITANYTFTQKKEGKLYRVPKHKLNANLQFALCADTFTSLSFQLNSDRISPFLNDDFSENRVLEAYSLINFDINHTLIENRLKLFASIINIFNEDYEELYHYSTLGRNYRFGFTLSF